MNAILTMEGAVKVAIIHLAATYVYVMMDSSYNMMAPAVSVCIKCLAGLAHQDAWTL